MTLRQLVLSLGLTFCCTTIAFTQKDVLEAIQLEESEDYYKKWLEEDVKYIIMDDERSVFKNLNSIEEKEQFIEQFWFRRDPDPRSAHNEYKDEHYRRIAYANEKFTSGFQGWRNDRGRVYIIHGEPAEIIRYPAGTWYERPMSEGGGMTAIYPMEIWRYRHVELIGDDILLEFVDKNMTGEYKLALLPEEKDALLHIDGLGKTMAEELGWADKRDRPFFRPGNRGEYPLMMQREQDSLFRRYETHAMIQRPLEIKYDDLRELVKVNVEYKSLDFSIREDYFQISDTQVLVPVSVQIRNKNLSYMEDAKGRHTARVAIYGIITSLTSRIVDEFEEDLMLSCDSSGLEQELLRSSMYQRVIPLDRKMRYRLDFVVKDLNSGSVGVIRRALTPPRYETEILSASSMLLSTSIRVLEEVPEKNERFVLGDVKILPSMQKVFSTQNALGVYLHVYNAALDQASFSPSLKVAYRLFNEGEMIRETIDEQGESTQYFSSRRVVLIKKLTFSGLEEGDYRIQVEIEDTLTGQRLTVSDNLKLVG